MSQALRRDLRVRSLHFPGFENSPVVNATLFQNATAKRMLMLAGQVYDLGSLCLRLLTAKCPACPRAVVVDLEHHPLGILELQVNISFSTCTTKSIGV